MNRPAIFSSTPNYYFFIIILAPFEGAVINEWETLNWEIGRLRIAGIMA
jgi:hypothetical protein